MYCKIIQEVFREPWGEIQIEKKWRENKMEGGQGLYRNVGWSRDFPKVYGEPLKSIRYWRRLFQGP
jgi:hypothetical protein